MADPLAFESERPAAFEWTDRAFDLLSNNALSVDLIERAGVTIAVATGECPRCAHDVMFTMERDVPLPGGGIGGLGDEVGLPEAEYDPVDIVCSCSGEHPGRPEDLKRGCGIVFRVEVRRAQ